MLFDLINFKKLKRALIYAAYLVLTLLAQELIFSRISILGVKAMFVPAAVAAVGLFEGGVWGGVFGLFAGLFCDMGYGNAALFVWLFPIIGFTSGMSSRFLVNQQLFAFLCFCLAAFLATAFFQSFRLWAFMNQPILPMIPTAVMQTLWSMPLAVPFYYICRRISRPDYEE